MNRKKEIIIIIIIFLFTIFLAFLPKIINNKNEENVEEDEDTPISINITIKGEIRVDELKIKIPYGYTYGYIITKIDGYLNKYSVISSDRGVRYFKDTTIIIESTDTKNINNDVVIKDKININTASSDELITLYGIGEKRAKAIIEYRKNKKIETFQELKDLLGVSDEVIRNIKEKAIL